jgi:CelD/BcsL family acetyltransferase involved in cellulose biosynthesis
LKSETTQISAFDPRETPSWDRFVAACPDGTVFHTSAWAEVLAETYSYEPRYFAAVNDSGDIVAGVPTMLVKSRITGRRMIGLPFSDACAPLLEGGEDDGRVLDALLEDYRAQGCAYIELRGGSSEGLAERGFRSFAFLRHEISLEPPLDEIESGFSSAKRRARNRALNEGLAVVKSTALEDMRALYGLYVSTRRKHGLPPAPFSFFENIQRFLIDRGMGCLLLAKWQEKTVAADLLLWHNSRLFYKFNVWDTRFQELRPNDLLLWEAIRLGKELSLTGFDLGRCEFENEGLRRFKKGWGGQESALPYFFYPEVRGFAAEAGASRSQAILSSFIRRTPTAVLSRLGAFYGHLA